MSINFYPYIHEPNTEAWGLPDAVSQDPERFELSLSSTNGMDVLSALGLIDPWSTEPRPIDSFANLVTSVLRQRLGHKSPAYSSCP